MENPGEKLDELEAEADDLEQRSEEVGEHTDQAGSDWDAKKQDESVPGAQPPDDERGGGDGTADAGEAGQ